MAKESSGSKTESDSKTAAGTKSAAGSKSATSSKSAGASKTASAAKASTAKASADTKNSTGAKTSKSAAGSKSAAASSSASDKKSASADTSASQSTNSSHGTVLRAHHLRPAPGAKTPKTRVGRGEGGHGGKTAGRGTKGTKARNQVPERFEGGQMPLHMRLPKLRGFTNPFSTNYQVVNLEKLSALFPDGGDVSVQDMVQAGAVRSGHLVKVLGQGEVKVALNVSAHAFSASATEKLQAAGGSATVTA